jgi:hypothetical protein
VAAGPEERIAAAKFDLGPEVHREAGEPLPWGYGECVVRALTVDPGHLFLYWEITDQGIEAARRRLPASEADDGAELCLRVYDVTGRIFDGTNAHHFTDVAVDRRQRQWFLPLAQPGSEHCAEIGLRAAGGAFARIARSRKAALPRGEPWPRASETWMTVRPGEGGGLEIECFESAAGSATDGSSPAGAPHERRVAAGTIAAGETPRPSAAASEAHHPGASEQSQPRSEAPWRGSGQS